MKRKPALFFLLLLLSFIALPVCGENSGRTYYDLGIFAYEDGEYEDAQKNFENALRQEPDNPDYRHWLGRTLLKRERFPEAKQQLAAALKQKPDLPGLKSDLAATLYKMSDYAAAADIFTEIAEKRPPEPGADFYAGLCFFKLNAYEKALGHFSSASEKNPGLRDSAEYYAGICHLKMGDRQKAAEKFESVRQNSRSETLKGYADRWLQALEKQRKADKPFRAWLKIGYEYDDNVRLEPLDEDLYADEDDYLTKAYASLNYNFLSRDRFRAGAGYSHYQTWHNDLDEYDLIGSIFNLNAKYNFSPFTLGLMYSPTYYWLDEDSFLLRHQFTPELTWRMMQKLATRLAYTYCRNKYFDNSEKDGHSNEVSLDLYYPVGKSGSIFGGIAYEDVSASHPDEYYTQWKSRLVFSFDTFWDINANLTGRYSDKRYDNADSDFGFRRKGKKYSAGVSISRKIRYDWLRCMLECDFTKNDSNIAAYDYERFTSTFSLQVSY